MLRSQGDAGREQLQMLMVGWANPPALGKPSELVMESNLVVSRCTRTAVLVSKCCRDSG
jgi:hypothetical protein